MTQFAGIETTALECFIISSGLVLLLVIYGIYKLIQPLTKNTKMYNHKEIQGEIYAPFLKELVCRIDNEGKNYTLLQGFYYESKSGDIITIPRGFISDGFTNKGMHFIVSQYGRGLKCAILHDYLCENFHKGLNTRKYADKIFLESMKEVRAFSIVRIYIIYLLVRSFAKIKGYK